MNCREQIRERYRNLHENSGEKNHGERENFTIIQKIYNSDSLISSAKVSEIN